jgi:hypothetical protein
VIAEIVISIVVNGRVVESSHCATLDRGVVVAPLDPFVRSFATAIESRNDGRIVISRGDAAIVLAIGSPFANDATDVRRLPMAPFVRDGEPIIPLGFAARALGASVSYDAKARVVTIHFDRAPLAAMTPQAGYVPPADPVTFAPTATPAPRVIVTGVPRPRRTPILIDTKI